MTRGVFGAYALIAGLIVLQLPHVLIGQLRGVFLELENLLSQVARVSVLVRGWGVERKKAMCVRCCVGGQQGRYLGLKGWGEQII